MNFELREFFLSPKNVHFKAILYTVIKRILIKLPCLANEVNLPLKNYKGVDRYWYFIQCFPLHKVIKVQLNFTTICAYQQQKLR